MMASATASKFQEFRVERHGKKKKRQDDGRTRTGRMVQRGAPLNPAAQLLGSRHPARILGGFGYWAATAPLSAAVIAQGSFVATGNNKIIQHLEGGIIKDLMVN